MRARYDSSQAQAPVPLTSEEVEDLLASDLRPVADAAFVRHLLGRVAATSRVQHDRLRGLQRDVERLHAQARTAADPVAGALELMSRMTLEQQSIVYDMRGRALVDAVRAAQEESEASRVLARSEVARARFALQRALADQSLPVAAREHLESALSQLNVPAEVETSPEQNPLRDLFENQADSPSPTTA